MVLNAGPGGNTVYVQETLAGIPVTINPGAGANTIAFGVLGDTLEAVRGSITVNGSGADVLLFDDQGNNSARVFALTAGAISWSAAGGIGATVGYSGAASLTADGGGGGNTFFVLASAAGTPVRIDGGSGKNTLVGSGAGNFWDLQAGLNFGLLYGPAYASQVSFLSVQNLTAGTGGDTFYFEDGASVSGNIIGSGHDTLSYTAYTTSVVVDLQTGTATAVGGTVSGIQAVEGGLAAPAAAGVYNLLIGNGRSLLVGGTGRRNILVAGGSGGTLIGGDREDLLIAGTTAYDTEAGLVTWGQRRLLGRRRRLPKPGVRPEQRGRRAATRRRHRHRQRRGQHPDRQRRAGVAVHGRPGLHHRLRPGLATSRDQPVTGGQGRMPSERSRSAAGSRGRRRWNHEEPPSRGRSAAGSGPAIATAARHQRAPAPWPPPKPPPPPPPCRNQPWALVRRPRSGRVGLAVSVRHAEANWASGRSYFPCISLALGLIVMSPRGVGRERRSSPGSGTLAGVRVSRWRRSRVPSRRSFGLAGVAGEAVWQGDLGEGQAAWVALETLGGRPAKTSTYRAIHRST